MLLVLCALKRCDVAHIRSSGPGSMIRLWELALTAPPAASRLTLLPFASFAPQPSEHRAKTCSVTPRRTGIIGSATPYAPPLVSEHPGPQVNGYFRTRLIVTDRSRSSLALCTSTPSSLLCMSLFMAYMRRRVGGVFPTTVPVPTPATRSVVLDRPHRRLMDACSSIITLRLSLFGLTTNQLLLQARAHHISSHLGQTHGSKMGSSRCLV